MQLSVCQQLCFLTVACHGMEREREVSKLKLNKTIYGKACKGANLQASQAYKKKKFLLMSLLRCGVMPL